MPIITFKEYLHDDFEEIDWRMKQQGIEITEEELQTIGRPFYEICLECNISTDTGAVFIMKINDKPLALPLEL